MRFAMVRLHRIGNALMGPLGQDQLCNCDISIRDDVEGGYLNPHWHIKDAAGRIHHQSDVIVVSVLTISR